jgi:hypothetical protein
MYVCIWAKLHTQVYAQICTIFWLEKLFQYFVW